jgi:hypothetical protein
MTINHLLDEVETNTERHQRFYLGISGIGNPNQRLLWMRYRWLMPDEWEPRVLRLLDLGNVVEDHLIEKLRKIPGAIIYDVQKDGKQFKTEALGGHVKGHIDGVARNLPGLKENIPYLLEFKTANDNRFKNLEKLGSYCAWSEEYDAQIHLYMGLFKMDHCIAIVYNKNNSALYTEVIDFDYLKFEMLMEKAEHVLKTNTPPDNNIPETDYRIRSFMSAKERAAYLGRSLPEKVHCRSCRFASVDINKGGGYWHCSQHDKGISEDRQTKGCPRHNYIPELIPATMIEEDDNFVMYEKDGFKFINVASQKESTGDNLYSSEELIEVINSGFPKELLEQCASAKRLMNGTIKSIRPWVETGVPF